MLDILSFATSFIQRPSATGALFPSSSRLATAIAKIVRKRRTKTRTVIELGAGTGSITRKINKAGLDDYVAFECNDKLADILERKNPGIRIHRGAVPDAISESYVGRSCVVVSSIPFRSLDADDRTAVSKYIQRLLAAKPENILVQYSYFPIKPFETQHDFLHWELKDVVLANFPPAYVWVMKHRAEKLHTHAAQP